MKHVEALETYCGKLIPSDAGEQGYHASKCLSCRIVRSLHSFDGRATARQVADKIDSGLCELLCHCFCHGEPQTEYVNPDVFFPPRSDDDIQEILEDDEA
jgi:hypothetical protein